MSCLIHEFQVKKTKKKGKRKKLTADDLEPLESESLVHLESRTARQARIEAMQAETQAVDGAVGGERQAERQLGSLTNSLRDMLEEEDSEVKKMEVEDEATESDEQDDVELQEAISRSRRVKNAQTAQPSSESILHMLQAKKKVCLCVVNSTVYIYRVSLCLKTKNWYCLFMVNNWMLFHYLLSITHFNVPVQN